MKQKHKMIICFMLLVTVFSTLLLTKSINVQSAVPEVTSVLHSPSIVSPQTNVTVTVTFNNDLNVTAIALFYCSISPTYLCHLPIDMISIGSDTWVGSFVVEETIGVIGYKLSISTLLSGTLIAPNSIDFLGYTNIVEPSTDNFYFSITLSTPTNLTPLMSWCGVVSSLAVIATTQLIRKRK
ncbi:MAG: hypothetical protein ACTSO7_15580 [Candidatus Heimdallarchaeota archaeon]